MEHNKEFLINEFWRYFNEFGSYPQGIDFKKKNGNYPILTSYTKQWGSWSNFLSELNIMGERNWYKCDEDVLKSHYEDGEVEEINRKLMIKRKWAAVVVKANSMGLSVKKEVRYRSKYDNTQVKETIMNEVKEFYQKYNKVPNIEELSFPRQAQRLHWRNYNELLIECEIPLPRRETKLQSKEDGIKYLQDLKIQLGKNPTVNDVEFNKNWFTDVFGSYKRALYEANLISKKEILTMKERIEASINALHFLYEHLDYLPTVEDYIIYQKQNKDVLSYNHLQTKLKMNYSDICSKYLGISRYNQKSKEDLEFELRTAILKHGRVPKAKELINFGLENRNVYTNIFGKPYNFILRDMGLTPAGHDTVSKTDEELLSDYYNLYIRIGRMPFADDINDNSQMASSETYRKRFENLYEVCDLLEIDWRSYISNNTSGLNSHYYFDKNNELCRSHQEMVISNILIDNQIHYIKEVPYAEYIQNDQSRRKFDWYLPDYNIFVEYFGMFNKKDIDKEEISYTKKSLMKIDDCKKNELKLIALFPWEVRRNFKSMIRKFNDFCIQINIMNSKETSVFLS